MNATTSTSTATSATGETPSLYARRQKIHIRSVSGVFNNWRIALVLLTQLIFYGGPWLQWNDRQAILFHLVERKFYLFGLIFWPQDVIYLAVLLVISAYALFLVTAVAGRLFCGYACPQTVYTQIFMWIEQWVEGDRNARIKLDKAPMDARKLRLRAVKFGLWALVSLWTGVTLVGYFTPMNELMQSLQHWTLGPWETFWIFFYAGFTMLMAGFMREQVCKYMCPYARFQSVMFDPDTLIIGYDEARGEPRGARRRGESGKALGACVDCNLCVHACPTGIDIRNGLQYECIGCAACIDACDAVMDKLGQPRGLVRYSTENGLSGKFTRAEMLRHVARPRVLLYTAILMVIVAATSWFLAHRIPLKVDVIRDRGVMAREVEGGLIENIYTLRFMNTDEKPHRYRLTPSGLAGLSLGGENEIEVPPLTTKAVTVALRADSGVAARGTHEVWLDIASLGDSKVHVREKAAFMLP